MDDNVFDFKAVKGGKGEDDNFPENDYVVIDVDNEEWYATGFLIFTPYHLAIMRDDGKGAVPVLVTPIARVKAAVVDERSEEEAI